LNETCPGEGREPGSRIFEPLQSIWIPAGVYPALDAGPEMTTFYEIVNFSASCTSIYTGFTVDHYTGFTGSDYIFPLLWI